MKPVDITDKTQDSPILVSGCMIVKNEERFLKDSLESLAQVCDEIVVVDTGSEDATMEIAQEAGARVFCHLWEDDFAKARNLSLDHAKGDWAIIMDADERLANPDPEKFRKGLACAPAEIDGVRVCLRDIQKIRTSDGISFIPRVNWQAPRIFRKERIRFFNPIHEQALCHDGSALCLGGSNLIIDHLGNFLEKETRIKKSQRNLKLINAWLKQDPENLMAGFYLSQTLYTRGKWEEAEKVAEDCLNRCDTDHPHAGVISTLFSTIASHRMEKGHMEMAWKWLQLGLSHFPDDLDLNFLTAKLATMEKGAEQLLFPAAMRYLRARRVHLENPFSSGWKFVFFAGAFYRDEVLSWIQ